MAAWAEHAGWPKEQVVIIDEEGKTAAIAKARVAFGDLITAVGRGEAGIVISLEVSRLARNSPDWHHLVYLSRWTDTLITDGETVNDPKQPADRMVLGIRGQVSELELDYSIQRMVDARWSKARRGEMMTIPPAGYDRDDLNQLVLSADESVAHAIRTVFAKLDELGSARQVLLWWRQQGLKYPVRSMELRTHPIVWLEPNYGTVLRTLHNPIYAGVYVFGRMVTVREIDPVKGARLTVLRRKREQWPVLIQDHHPAYISFEKYLTIQELMKNNTGMKSSDLKGPAREGEALLQGVVRCGRCGRAMHISYGGHRSEKAHRTMQYRCMAGRSQIGASDCQTIGGKRIDQTVVEVFLEAVAPAGQEILKRMQEQWQTDNQALDHSWTLQVEKAEYEAHRAERQFQAVEPENRIVARELERRWNDKLKELDEVRQKAQLSNRKVASLSEEEMTRARDLAQDLGQVWRSPTTTNRDRKRLLRCLIDEVQLTTEDRRYRVRILWKGGAVTDREVVRLAPGAATPKTGRH